MWKSLCLFYIPRRRLSINLRNLNNKSVAQVALRWLIQSGVIIIPKSTRKERMAENLNTFDFALDADDMAAIALLDEKHSFFIDHHDGQIAKQFMEWRSLVEPAK